MLTREMFIRGASRIEFEGFKEMIEKAKEVVEKLQGEERDFFDDTVIYFQIDNGLLKLKIYDNDNGLQEIGSTEVLEFTGEGEYRDIDASYIIDIYNFVNQFEKETLVDGVIYVFFSVKKVIINIDNDCLIVL
jgi:hypothetical protein